MVSVQEIYSSGAITFTKIPIGMQKSSQDATELLQSLLLALIIL